MCSPENHWSCDCDRRKKDQIRWNNITAKKKTPTHFHVISIFPKSRLSSDFKQVCWREGSTPWRNCYEDPVSFANPSQVGSPSSSLCLPAFKNWLPPCPPSKPNTHTHSRSTPTLPPLPLCVGADQPTVTWVAKRPLQVTVCEHRFPPPSWHLASLRLLTPPPHTLPFPDTINPPPPAWLEVAGQMGWGEVMASSFLLVPLRGLWRWVTGVPGFSQRKMLLGAKVALLTDI